MVWVIERQGARITPRGWVAGADAGTKFPTQGEAQEALDEMLRGSLAALGGNIQIKDIGPWKNQALTS
jgi:hypothetical protein